MVGLECSLWIWASTVITYLSLLVLMLSDATQLQYKMMCTDKSQIFFVSKIDQDKSLPALINNESVGLWHNFRWEPHANVYETDVLILVSQVFQWQSDFWKQTSPSRQCGWCCCCCCCCCCGFIWVTTQKPENALLLTPLKIQFFQKPQIMCCFSWEWSWLTANKCSALLMIWSLQLPLWDSRIIHNSV